VSDQNLNEIVAGIKSGEIVPYIGPGVLKNVVNKVDQKKIPAESDELILAMTGGQPMSPRLMYEFPRAAMHLENKKGRKFLEKFLTETYANQTWSVSAFHEWLSKMDLPYLVDINRDQQIVDLYKEKDHTLVVGAARLAAHPYRFDIYEFSNGSYRVVELTEVNKSLPVIFKPLGCPQPKPSFVASDADFVDYITELMGGFAIPNWIKDYRQGKHYVFVGMRFTRDTERMVMSDIIYAAGEPAGYALIAEPTDKEKRFLDKKNIVLIEQDCEALLDVVEQGEAEVA